MAFWFNWKCNGWKLLHLMHHSILELILLHSESKLNFPICWINRACINNKNLHALNQANLIYEVLCIVSLNFISTNAIEIHLKFSLNSIFISHNKMNNNHLSLYFQVNFLISYYAFVMTLNNAKGNDKNNDCNLDFIMQAINFFE